MNKVLVLFNVLSVLNNYAYIVIDFYPHLSVKFVKNKITIIKNLILNYYTNNTKMHLKYKCTKLSKGLKHTI